MRGRRLLRQMAGLVATPLDRVRAREERRLAREMREREEAVMLVDRIRAREAGEVGVKPMPYVGLRREGE